MGGTLQINRVVQAANAFCRQQHAVISHSYLSGALALPGVGQEVARIAGPGSHTAHARAEAGLDPEPGHRIVDTDRVVMDVRHGRGSHRPTADDEHCQRSREGVVWPLRITVSLQMWSHDVNRLSE